MDEEDKLDDFSDTELDAAIISNPLTGAGSHAKKKTSDGAMVGLANMADGDFFSSSSSSDDEDEDDNGREPDADGYSFLNLTASSTTGNKGPRTLDALREKLAAAQAARLPILTGMSEEEQHRYRVFRTCKFPRPVAKRLITQVWGDRGVGMTASLAVIVVSGIAKVFIGELVEEARAVAEQWGDLDDDQDRALMPSHYLEAHRRLLVSGRIPSGLGPVTNQLL